MKTIITKNFNKFNELSEQTSLNSTLQSFCDLGRLQEALKLIFSTPIHCDYTLYSKILQVCIDKKSQKEGRLIHNHLITNGFHSNLHINTKLIIHYANIGDMFSARKVFDVTPERSVVSWTALLSGYSRNGYSEEAFLVFSEMHKANVKANQFTYGSALRACTALKCLDRGKQVHGCVQKGRFFENLFVQSALIDFHSKCGNMEDAFYVFESISERDMVSWNTMIGGYAIRGLADKAFHMFRSMLRGGMIPDSFTLGSVLKASIGGSCLIKVGQIHAFVVQLGFVSHNILSGSLIDAYAKCGDVRNATAIYKNMLKKDTVSCTALITVYAREGNYIADAFDLFNEIHQLRLGIDDVMLCSMLNVCAKTASLGLGKQVHALGLKYQARQDVAMGNSLIDMYAKSGEIEDAKHVFDEMGDKNVISWTSMIAGYGKNGNGHKAVALYKKMECKGLKPNDVTLLSLLFACSHAGLVSEGLKCFNSMVGKYNVSLRAEHYSCMVDLFARGGRLEEAYDMIRNTNIKPNSSLWGAILGACSVHENMSLGEVAAGMLFNMDPKNAVNYVVLASIYASSGLWENAREARKLIGERNIRKNPGFSFLQSTNQRVALLPAS